MTTTSGRGSEGQWAAARRPFSWIRVEAVLLAAALLGAGTVRLGAEPGAAPRFEWAVDGTVHTTARSGNTLYVGGGFRNVLPVTGVLGQVYAVSPATGAVVPSIIPRLALGTSAFATVSDGAGGFFLRGNLMMGSGDGANRVVHLRADGTVDPVFQSPAELSGYGSMVRVGPSLVLAGFNVVGGVYRPLLALDAVTGALSSWHPDVKDDDHGKAIVAANGILYVASGYFYGGTRRIMAFDGTTGTKLWEDDLGAGLGLPGRALILAGGRLIAAAGGLRAYDPATGVRDTSWGAVTPDAVDGIWSMASDGATVYLAGSFITLDGQPRSRLGAVSVATGALLPWAPQASAVVDAVSIAPTGAVFVSGYELRVGQGTVNGQSRSGGLFEIDGAGAVTPFEIQVTTESARVATFANGALLISGAEAFAGAVARQGVAAFDVTTGALLPLALTLAAGPGVPPDVRQLVAHGSTLHLTGLFTGVNGAARHRAATVDAVTGALAPAWSLAGLVPTGIGPFFGGHLYVSLLPDPPPMPAVATLRRLNPATGQLDPTWQPTLPSVQGVIEHRGALLVQSAIAAPNGVTTALVIDTVDVMTAQAQERFRGLEGGLMLPDGDTMYLLVRDPTVQYNAFEFGRMLSAFDLATGVPVMRPPISGRIYDVAFVDGRLVIGGRNLSVAGSEGYGAIELNRSGARSTWDAGFRPIAAYHPIGGAPGGIVVLDAHGDVLVAAGTLSTAVSRVAVFALSGSTAPSGLRARALGDQVEFTWDAAAHPPAGGYVLEGGFSAGQTAGSLAVGSTTSFTAPVAVFGPAFVRVRSHGETDVSNEAVVGCLAPPLPPTALTTTLSGSTLTLSWTASAGAVTTYTLLAGTASGLTDVATLPVGALTSASGQVPGGTFFTRITATNACGTSGPSGEVFFTIGAPEALPAAPTNLTSTVAGSMLTLSWTAPAGPVTGYVLEAGSAPGLANIGAATIGAGTSFVIPGVPAGTYYVRARAITNAGSGAPSSDVVVVVVP